MKTSIMLDFGTHQKKVQKNWSLVKPFEWFLGKLLEQKNH